MGAGLLLAVATLLKLHVGLILPFLLLRRRFSVSAAYAVGMGLIVITSLLVAPALSVDYVTHQLPRISVYGEGGTEAMLLSPEPLERLLAGVPEGMTRLASSDPTSDRIYMREYFSFFANGTLVREVMPTVQRLGLPWSISRLSMGLFLLCFGALALWQWLNRDIYRRGGDTHRQRVEPCHRRASLLDLGADRDPYNGTGNVGHEPRLAAALVRHPRGRGASGEHAGTGSPVSGRLSSSSGLLRCSSPLSRIASSAYGVTAIFQIPEWLLYPWGWVWASRKYLVAEGLLLISIAGYVTVAFGAATAGRQQAPGPRNGKSAVESALFISKENPG